MTAEAEVSSQPVLLDKLEAGVLTLTLNRPERLNALNAALTQALSAAIERAAADPECRAILITGAGRGFCAGADLADRAVAPGGARPDLGQSLEKGLNPLIRAIRNLPKPVVCAVNGPAAGAGANLALACDIVLAAKSAQFLQAFARIGLIPDAGGTFNLPRLDRRRARPRADDAGRADRGGTGSGLGHDLSRGRRRGPDGGSAHRRGAPRGWRDARARPHQARARRFAQQQSRRPARPRARSAARGRFRR